jgi:hypothetical protein
MALFCPKQDWQWENLEETVDFNNNQWENLQEVEFRNQQPCGCGSKWKT